MLKIDKKISLVFAVSFILIISIMMNAIGTVTATEMDKTDLNQQYIIKHALGETSVSHAPKRIVTLYQGATDSIVALGITPIGVVESWAEKPTYKYLRSALKGVPHVGLETQPNLEAIAALKPDLIIGAKSRHEKIYSQLSKIAPTVVSHNVYDFKYSFELAAESTRNTNQGHVIWKAWEERVAKFKQIIQEKESVWPISVSVLNIREDHLRLYLQESFTGTVLKEIGFTFSMPNKAGWGVKLKTKEALPTANADMFFIILHNPSEPVKQNYKAWSAHPLWRVLDAPKYNNVYEVDRVSWLLSGGLLGANLMLDQLYHQFGLTENP